MDFELLKNPTIPIMDCSKVDFTIVIKGWISLFGIKKEIPYSSRNYN